MSNPCAQTDGKTEIDEPSATSNQPSPHTCPPSPREAATARRPGTMVVRADASRGRRSRGMPPHASPSAQETRAAHPFRSDCCLKESFSRDGLSFRPSRAQENAEVSQPGGRRVNSPPSSPCPRAWSQRKTALRQSGWRWRSCCCPRKGDPRPAAGRRRLRPKGIPSRHC